MARMSQLISGRTCSECLTHGNLRLLSINNGVSFYRSRDVPNISQQNGYPGVEWSWESVEFESSGL